VEEIEMAKLVMYVWMALLILLITGTGQSAHAADPPREGEAVSAGSEFYPAPGRAGVSVRIRTDDDYEDAPGSPQIRLRRGKGRVTFRYTDEDYVLVAVTGSFNDWEAEPMKLDTLTGNWTYRVTLKPGRYSYRFIVEDEDGEWEAIDPENDNARRDDKYGWVSRFKIRDKRHRYRDNPVQTRFCREEMNRLYGKHSVGLDYQRVDGLFLFIAPGAYARHSFGTSIRGRAGYGFSSREWSASGTVAQPLISSGRLQILLSAYAETAYTDQTGIGNLENVLAVSMFRSDFRDYHRREGVATRLVYNIHRLFRVEAGYRADDYKSLENKTSWSMSSGDFRPNLPVQEGNMRSVFGEVHWGSDNVFLRVNYETSGDHITGGDFDFKQLTALGRTQIYLGPSQRFDMRVKYGTNLSGLLPNQRRYFVGGLGTVRGYEYQSLLVGEADTTGYFGGQQMLLANIEYKFGIGLGFIGGLDDDWYWDWDGDVGFDFALFFDTGMAWSDKDAVIKLDDLKSSAGVGFLFGGDDGFRLNVIWPFEDRDKDVVFQARLQRMF
jgi:hypothetical protein